MHLDISDAYAQLSEYRALELTESLKFCCAKKQHKKLAKQLERLVQGCKTEESQSKTTRRATCSMRVTCFCTSSIEEWPKTGCWRTKPQQGAEVLNFDRFIYIFFWIHKTWNLVYDTVCQRSMMLYKLPSVVYPRTNLELVQRHASPRS